MKIKAFFAALLVGTTLIVSLNLPKVVNARVKGSEIREKLEQLKTELDLTPSQERRIRATFRATLSQINDIFTATQKQEMKMAWEEGKTLRQVLSVANISSEQRSQIKRIWQEQKQTFRNIFTPEQREILRREIRTYFQENSMVEKF